MTGKGIEDPGPGDSSHRPDRRPWMFILVLTGVVIMLAILVAVWLSGLAGGIAPDSQQTTNPAKTVAALVSGQAV